MADYVNCRVEFTSPDESAESLKLMYDLAEEIGDHIDESSGFLPKKILHNKGLNNPTYMFIEDIDLVPDSFYLMVEFHSKWNAPEEELRLVANEYKVDVMLEETTTISYNFEPE